MLPVIVARCASVTFKKAGRIDTERRTASLSSTRIFTYSTHQVKGKNTVELISTHTTKITMSYSFIMEKCKPPCSLTQLSKWLVVVVLIINLGNEIYPSIDNIQRRLIVLAPIV